MNKFLGLTDSRRRNVYESVAQKVGLLPQVVEKDFWVTAILQAVFTLPMAGHLVFKGGTSLSKGWKLIDRFSEDIDLAMDPILLGVPKGDLTKKQIKKLRKASSLFVMEKLTPMIGDEMRKEGLDSFIKVDPQPSGAGDKTYPEPRQIYLHYKSVFDKSFEYLRPDVVLEVSSRSLLEPTKSIQIKSILGENLPITPLTDSVTHTAIPAKTFLEKVFLLHELFSVPGHGVIAERKSRHLYDLYVMMNKDFAREAVKDDDLWESIRHHREIYTSVRDVDYSPDVRRRLRLIPGEDILNIWRDDYDAMSELIYGNRPSFEELLEGLSELQRRFREVL